MADAPVELPAPTASGTFAKTPLVQVLVYVLERGLTGTIEVIHPDGPWATLLVLEGMPSKGRTSEPVAYLGNVLRERGYIDDAALNSSLAAMAKERKLHGQILRESGKITASQLTDGLRSQLVKKLEHLFDWPPETKFAYYDGFDGLHNYGGDDEVSVDPLPLVWAAVRTHPPWEHVHAALTRVGGNALRIAATAQVERFEFSKEERGATELLRAQPMRVHDLAATKVLGASATQLLTYCLLITKQVEVVPLNDAAVQRLARVRTTQVVQRAAVEEHHPRVVDPRSASNSPYPPSSTASAASPSSIPAPASPSSPPSPRNAPSDRPKTASERMRAATPGRLSSGRIVTPELEKRKAEILARATAIKSEDYFQMLGVARDATSEQVQSAFFMLAKVWHPDRVPKAIAEVRDACATVFAHMSEAQQTLCDPKRREGYMQLVKDGGATPDEQAQVQAVLEAATIFQKAEFYLKKSDLKEAEALCRRAAELDSVPPEYTAMLAWLEALKIENQGPEATLARIRLLDQAISKNPRLERAYFYRGMLYKRINNLHAAVRDFRESAELNPRNLDAVREVRLFEMRKSKGSIPPPAPEDGPSSRRTGSVRPPPPGKKDAENSGIFGKLFKK
jgi:tetratricopeptide (TPR) repeat protein